MRFLVLMLCTSCSGQTFSSSPNNNMDAGSMMETSIADDAGTTGIRVVQATQTSISAGIDPTVSFQVPPVAGNAVIVGMTCFSEVDNCVVPPSGVTDNQNNTYVRVIEGDSIVSSNTHGSRGYIFIAENIRAPNGTFTIAVNPNGDPATNYQ